MLGSVHCILSDEASEKMNAPQEVIGDVHEERKEAFADGKNVVTSWFFFNQNESFCGLLEQECDSFGSHVLTGLLSQKLDCPSCDLSSLDTMGTVDDCNDDDDCKRICSC